MEKPGPSFSSENISQKMFIGTDKISEIVNDSDSDGGSLVNFLVATHAKQIHSSAAAAATARKRKFSQNLTEAQREYLGPFLKVQIQILI